jgi:hypothetical protein
LPRVFDGAVFAAVARFAASFFARVRSMVRGSWEGLREACLA